MKYHHPHFQSIVKHVDSILKYGGSFKLRCAATGRLNDITRDEAIDLFCKGLSENVVVDRVQVNWADKLAEALEQILLAPSDNQRKVRDDAKALLSEYIQHSICDSHRD